MSTEAEFTIGDLRRLISESGVDDTAPVRVLYEMFAERAVDPEGTGVDDDGILWIVAEDP